MNSVIPRNEDALLTPASQLLETVASVSWAVMAVPITKTIAKITMSITSPLPLCSALSGINFFYSFYALFLSPYFHHSQRKVGLIVGRFGTFGFIHKFRQTDFLSE